MIDGEEFSGCYEKYASAKALISGAKKIDASYDDLDKIFADREQPKIKELLDAWIDEVTIGLLTLAHVFNPSDIIMEGKVMAHKWLIEEIERRLMKNVGPGYGDIKLHTSGLLNFAGLMGAAYLASMY
jgi:predicted NBD/HSP70 family sugar kinase